MHQAEQNLLMLADPIYARGPSKVARTPVGGDGELVLLRTVQHAQCDCDRDLLDILNRVVHHHARLRVHLFCRHAEEGDAAFC